MEVNASLLGQMLPLNISYDPLGLVKWQMLVALGPTRPYRGWRGCGAEWESPTPPSDPHDPPPHLPGQPPIRPSRTAAGVGRGNQVLDRSAVAIAVGSSCGVLTDLLERL